MGNRFTADEDDYIIRHYADRYLRDIAAELGRHPHSIVSRVSRLTRDGALDVRTRHYHPRWAERELELLHDKYGLVPDEHLAKLLGRSVVSLRLKAKRCGLAKKLNIFTLRDVGRIFNVDDHKVARWISDGKLRAARAGFRQGPNRVWRIDIEAIEAFIRQHPTEYDPLRIDDQEHYYFRRLALRHGSRDVPAFARAWTVDEEKYLVEMYRHVAVKEIARRLRRPYKSVHAKATKLRREGYPIGRRQKYRAPHATDWTPAQDAYLRMRWGVVSVEELAAAVGHTERACAWRARKLGLSAVSAGVDILREEAA